MYSKKNLRQAFTVVELIIVVLIIGILVSLTVVAYNGIQKKASETALLSDLDNAMSIIEHGLSANGVYPDMAELSDSKSGLPTDSGTTYQYDVDNASVPPTFCLTGTNRSISYYINSSSTTATKGACPGHGGPSLVAPNVASFTDFSANTPGSGTINVGSLAEIPDGSWMIIVLSYTDNVTPNTPSGWTVLINRDTTGTMRTIAYGKIKTSSDSDTALQMTIPTGAQTLNGGLIWGSGGGLVDSWIIGSIGKRAVNATSTTTVSPSIVTTVSRSLVLSISTERTTAAEAGITSMNGATPCAYIAQIGTSKIQTISFGSFEQISPGPTGTVTTAYPNSQASNGMAFQVAIPPL